MGLFSVLEKLDNKYNKFANKVSGVSSKYESKYNQYNTKINKYKNKYTSIYNNVSSIFEDFQSISNSTFDIKNSGIVANVNRIESVNSEFNKTLSNINANVSRQNKFKILMTLPSLSDLSFFTDVGIIDTYIQNASLPSQSLNLSEVRYLNKEYISSLFVTTDTINITFYDTQELIIRNMFLGWQTAINPIDSLDLLKYFPDEYQTSFKMYVHETGYEVTDAIPITVGDFVIDHNSTNTLGTFTVTFKCKKVVPLI